LPVIGPRWIFEGRQGTDEDQLRVRPRAGVAGTRPRALIPTAGSQELCRRQHVGRRCHRCGRHTLSRVTSAGRQSGLCVCALA
jgi:hypothetical protein